MWSYRIYNSGGGSESVNLPTITNASYLFYKNARLNCLEHLVSLCKQVVNVSNMFADCTEVTSVDLSGIEPVGITDINNMFTRCTNLTDLNLDNFDASNVTTTMNAFTGCSALTNLKFMKNLGKAYTQAANNYAMYKVDLYNSQNLTHDSLMSIINNVYDLTLVYSGTTYTQALRIGATNKAKLTVEEIAMATNKGWTIA